MTVIRVLSLVTQLSPSGGIPTVVRQLIAAASGRIEHHVCQIRPISEQLADDQILGPHRLHSLDLEGPWTRRPGSIAASMRFLGTIRRLEPDIVHVHTGSSIIGAPAKLVLRSGPSWLIDLHEPIEQRHSRVTSAAVRMMARRRAWCVTHSTEVRDEVTRVMSIPDSRLSMIPLGVPTEEYATPGVPRDAWRLRMGFDPEDVLVITVGRVSERKGLSLLLEVADLVSASEERVRFVMIGRSESADLQDVIESRGLSGTVFALGFVDDLPSALSAADIYFTPSAYEGFGLSVVEGMAAGLPVVASDIGGLRDVVAHDTTGFLVDPEDAAGFAESLQSLARQSLLRANLGLAGRRRASERFSVQAMAGAYEDLYEGIATDPH